MIAWLYYMKNKEKDEFKYFLPFVFWKLTLGMTFAAIYIYVYGGGDTTAYFQGAETLKNLCFENPSAYLKELFSTPIKNHIPSYFNHITGRPPIWIYSEPNSWFICKIGSVFSFLSFKSYVVVNLWFTIISTIISWQFFTFLSRNTNFKQLYLAIAILFVPTVGFWCSGIMKDTVVLIAIQLFLIAFFTIVYFKFKISQLIILIIAIYVLLATRSFILIALFIPIVILLTFKLNSKSSFLIKIVTRSAGITISILGIWFFINGSEVFGEFSADNIAQTAETIYLDFQNNSTYSGKRYDLGITDFDANSIIKATPMAIITAIFRPFLWEAESALMLINGIEGTLLIYLSLQLFKRKNNNKIEMNKFTKDLILYCIIFSITMAFFVGFTSGLFGVLARFKAPILPFFLIFVFQHKLKDDKNTEVLSES